LFGPRYLPVHFFKTIDTMYCTRYLPAGTGGTCGRYCGYLPSLFHLLCFSNTLDQSDFFAFMCMGYPKYKCGFRISTHILFGGHPRSSEAHCTLAALDNRYRCKTQTHGGLSVPPPLPFFLAIGSTSHPSICSTQLPNQPQFISYPYFLGPFFN
jgi:hypothetical protein